MYKFKSSRFTNALRITGIVLYNTFNAIGLVGLALLFTIGLLGFMCYDAAKREILVKEYAKQNDLHALCELKTREYLLKFKINPDVLVCDPNIYLDRKYFSTSCKYSVSNQTLSGIHVQANLQVRDSVEIKSWEFLTQ